MIELTDEIILRIDDLLDNWTSLAVHLNLEAHRGMDIPSKYSNDEILVEYFNGVKYCKGVSKMRNICLPKYIRRELSKNN